MSSPGRPGYESTMTGRRGTGSPGRRAPARNRARLDQQLAPVVRDPLFRDNREHAQGSGVRLAGRGHDSGPHAIERSIKSFLDRGPHEFLTQIERFALPIRLIAHSAPFACLARSPLLTRPPRNPHRAYDADGYEIPPLTLDSMRAQGARSALAFCTTIGCGHEARVNGRLTRSGQSDPGLALRSGPRGNRPSFD
jgi:hypothetical protein